MVCTTSGSLHYGTSIGGVIDLRIKGGVDNPMSNIPGPSHVAACRLLERLEGSQYIMDSQRSLEWYQLFFLCLCTFSFNFWCQELELDLSTLVGCVLNHWAMFSRPLSPTILKIHIRKCHKQEIHLYILSPWRVHSRKSQELLLFPRPLD